MLEFHFSLLVCSIIVPEDFDVLLSLFYHIEPVVHVVLCDFYGMADEFEVSLFEEEVMLLVVASHSQSNIRRDHDVSPVSPHQAARPILLLLARSIAGKRPVGLGVLAKTLLEGQTGQSPLLVVIVMHNGRAGHQEHVKVPVHQVRPIVVAFFEVESQFLVS
jgi:hypothetical protein